MATRENTDYLRFSAFAIRDLITRKLAQDSNYTDQVYPGSNLAILIDIISYMYQTLMYNLNSAAAETMWSDTKIYENINRLSQFLGYNPHGMNPLYGVFSLPSDFSGGLIPRYSYIDAGETDSAGNPVFFSTIEDIEIRSDDTNKEIVLYNGKWKLYNTVFTAEGTDWETFVLNGLRSDSATGDYVGNNFIHVYVANPGKKPERFYMTDSGLLKTRNEFFNNSIVYDVSIGMQSTDVRDGSTGMFTPIPRLYQSNDKVFNLRLDETKTYTITFGNGRQGEKPQKGAAIYVFYLDSNGPGLDFSPGQINGTLFSNIFSYQQTQNGVDFKAIFDEKSGDIINYIENVELISPTLGFAMEESVDEIRDFAPNWFRMGNRLVTKRDYEYYVKNAPAFRGTFADVKCMNNWEYMATFYKWLYEMGIRYHKEIDSSETKLGRRFLTQSKLLESRRRYADPADSNNIYLWTLYNSSEWNSAARSHDDIIDGARANLLQVKDITHEPEFILPIKVAFAVCAANDEYLLRAFEGIDTDDDKFDEFLKKKYSEEFLAKAKAKEKEELQQAEKDSSYVPKTIADFINPFKNSYIEITIDDEVIYTSSALQNQIKTIIKNFFEENKKLGGYVDFNDLQNRIFDINGVNKIRTVYKDQVSDNDKNYIVRNGISFASWSYDDILVVKKNVPKIDLEVSSAGRSLEAFQYASLVNFDKNTSTNTEEKINYIDDINIKIIKRSAAALNTVAY